MRRMWSAHRYATLPAELGDVAGVEKAVLERILHELRSSAQAELLHPTRLVRLDRTDAEEQLLGDLQAGMPEGDQSQDLHLTS